MEKETKTPIEATELNEATPIEATEFNEDTPIEATNAQSREEIIEPEKKERTTGEKAKRAAKVAIVSVIGLLALRGGAEVADDVSRAKDFIQESGYSMGDYLKDTYSDVLIYGDETKTVIVNTPANLEEIVANSYKLAEGNIPEVVEYIEELNQNSKDIFRNNIGEIGPNSKLTLPESVEAKSPIAVLMEYVFDDSIDEIDIKPGQRTTENKPEGASPIEPEQRVANVAGFPNELVDYTVQTGDSLWGIANRLCQEAGIKSDQEVIDTIIGYIKNINNKTDDQIEAGAKLKVPPNLSEAFKIANNTSELDPTS